MKQRFEINEYGEIISQEEHNTNNRKWIWIIIFIIIAIVLFLYAYNDYSHNYENDDDDIHFYSSNEQISNSTLINDSNNVDYVDIPNTSINDSDVVESTADFTIEEVILGNNDYDGNNITPFGNSLYSSEMRYLMPRIIYSSDFAKSITLYYKLFDANNNLMSYSGDEFTADNNVDIHPGESNYITLDGWGNNSESIYPPGVYKIEIWYNNACIYYAEFLIQ